MKNLFLLPTSNPSRLFIIDKSKMFISEPPYLSFSTVGGKVHKIEGEELYQPQYLYITSDKVPKEGDWCYSEMDGVGKWCGPILTHEPQPKKIILTNDPNLINDGIQAIDDTFLKWFVENPSCEFVEVKDITTIPSLQLGRPNGHLMYKIIIPQEEPKQETDDEEKEFRRKFPKEFALIDMIKLDEAQEKPKQQTLEQDAKKYAVNKRNKKNLTNREFDLCQKDFIEGAKWQAERMYSEALEFAQWISHNDWVYLPSKNYWVNEEQEELEQKLSSEQILELWFKENKNK
jgi:hypothetical protein